MEELVKRVIALLEAIDKCKHNLWEGILDDTHTAVLYDECVVNDGCDDDDDCQYFPGIKEEVEAVKKVLKDGIYINDGSGNIKEIKNG